MNKFWCYFAEGLKYEEPIGEKRMGESQSLASQDELVIEEQVNIYGAVVVVSVHALVLATELTFDGLGMLKYLQWWE